MSAVLMAPPAAGIDRAASPVGVVAGSPAACRSATAPRDGGAGVGAVGGEPTLDTIVSAAWEGLAARAAVQCPVCQGALLPQYGAHALPVGGRCAACGTELS